MSDTQVFLLCLFFCLVGFLYFWSPAACRVFTEDYEIDAERGEGRIGGGGNCESSLPLVVLLTLIKLKKMASRRKSYTFSLHLVKLK